MEPTFEFVRWSMREIIRAAWPVGWLICTVILWGVVVHSWRARRNKDVNEHAQTWFFCFIFVLVPFTIAELMFSTLYDALSWTAVAVLPGTIFAAATHVTFVVLARSYKRRDDTQGYTPASGRKQVGLMLISLHGWLVAMYAFGAFMFAFEVFDVLQAALFAASLLVVYVVWTLLVSRWRYMVDEDETNSSDA